ncbi:MAG: hypothetical protein HQM10_10460 [Candidatus Riflebacteria bacterium]|nr:hypothetical protein [Candidatus Riflebacteria bacterium]
MKYSACIIFMIMILASINGCIETNVPADKMFQVLIANPIPKEIKELQGSGYTWQGHLIFLRFKTTSAEAITKIISKGYAEAEWKEISYRFDLPEEFKTCFTPPWNATMKPGIKCYSKKNVSNSWTENGEHFLFIDEENLTIYFIACGA